ncbi:MAG: CRISPR-associated helicase Cas3' [Chitinophagales bacterium]
MTFYAHSIGDDKSNWQPLRAHLESVAALSKTFADRFSAGDFGYAAGLLHDIGKYSSEFQRRLEGHPCRVDHSTAGAKEALALLGKSLGTLLAYVVAGHHAGLPDYRSDDGSDASLVARLEGNRVPDYSAYRREHLSLPDPSQLRLPIRPIPEHPGFSVHFFIRMLYSCLVDADYLDTELAMGSLSAAARGSHPPLPKLKARLDCFLAKRFAGVPQTPINQRRAEILSACQDKAGEPPGLFSLTVPTGGGKTLSSLAFALHHAVHHGLERVIYVIPFTSIIEQNAAVFREVVGPEAVVEHHSNFSPPVEASEDDDGNIAAQHRLATENWDAPLIVTTNVQFFESLFANRSSRCRKLHNLAKSVIILDEAQMLPTPLLRTCLAALCELTINYASSVVLCTATQPALGTLLPASLRPREIVSDPPRLYAAFRRTKVTPVGRKENAELAADLLQHHQVLCIVNTRQHALELYRRIADVQGAYHLSARMCAVHRSAKLKAIRQALAEGEECRVVSTQLIEAGVDVDFPVVYRSATGLDSIAQAAGRCNREGRRQQGDVFVFEPADQELTGWLNLTAGLAGEVMQATDDPLSLEAVEQYFTLLYSVQGDGLDQKRVLAELEEGRKSLAFPFASVAERFRLIENNMVPVVVGWDEQVRNLISRLPYLPISHRLVREFQPYSVQVYPHEFSALQKAGLVRTEGGVIHVLTDESAYSDETGLQTAESPAFAEGAVWLI